MNILNKLLYSKLYSEEGGEAPAGGSGGENPADINGGSQILDGGADGSGGETNLLAGKFKSADELEKGYTEAVSMSTKKSEQLNDLQDKLKGFAGAPEGDYEVVEGFDGYSEPVMNSIAEWGKENGLSQEAYNSLLSSVSAAEAANVEAYQQAEMAAIGKDAQIRIDNANDKLNVIFGEDTAAMIQNIGSSAAGFSAVEAILEKLGESTVNPDGSAAGATVITQQEIGELLNAKTEGGAPKMNIPEYAASVNATIEKFNKQQGI